MHWLKMKLALALLVAGGVVGCGGATADEPAVSPGSDFADVFSADLAGDANGLAWVMAGQLRAHARRLDVRVYRRASGGGWTPAPQLAKRPDSGGQPSLAVIDGAPCVGYAADGGPPVLACLRGGRWHRLPSAGLPAAPAQLTKLSGSGGRPIAVFSTAGGAGSRTTVLRLDGTRWHVLGRPLATHGAIVTLGEATGAGATLDLALLDVPGRQRSLLTFDAGRWHRSAPLAGVGAGPMPGGPVRLGERAYMPVVDADATPWRFSVFVLGDAGWTRLGAPLNSGPGNAQGVLSASGGGVWATWQQDASRADGRFDTRVYAQRVAPSRGAARLVWQGITIGPGSVETVQGAGGRSVLYMPSAAGGRGLTARVEPLR
jgi:hypothetical protein